MMLSMRQTVPSRPFRVSDILRWKCSGADDIPNGRRRKLWKPNGVMKVVRSAEAGDRGICQTPELASNVANTFALASCARVWSMAGSWCLSLLML